MLVLRLRLPHLTVNGHLLQGMAGGQGVIQQGVVRLWVNMQGRLGLGVTMQGRLWVGLKLRLGLGMALNKRKGQRVYLGVPKEDRLGQGVAIEGKVGLCEILQGRAGLTEVQHGAWLQGREGLTVGRSVIPDRLQGLGNDRVERQGNPPRRLAHGLKLGKCVGEGRGGLRCVVGRSRLMKAVFNRPWRLAGIGKLLLLVGRLFGVLVSALGSRAAGLPHAGRIVVPALLLPLHPAPTRGRPHALTATGGGTPRHCRSHAEMAAPEHQFHPLVLDPVQQPANVPLLSERHEAVALPTLQDRN